MDRASADPDPTCRSTQVGQTPPPALAFVTYAGEHQLPLRYFLNAWPDFCILVRFGLLHQIRRSLISLIEQAMDGELCVATVVGKHDLTRKRVRRGYIAMLVVEKSYRKLGLGSKLVHMLVDRFAEAGCLQVVLETEVTNQSAVRLYEKLGFIKDKRLHRYYMNGVDAFRLKRWLPVKTRSPSQ